MIPSIKWRTGKDGERLKVFVNSLQVWQTGQERARRHSGTSPDVEFKGFAMCGQVRVISRS